MKTHYAALFLISLSSIISFSCIATNTEYSGAIEIENRYFFEVGQYSEQKDQQQWSIALHPEFSWQSENSHAGQWQAHVELFYREDSLDDERSHGDIRQAYIRWQQGDIAVLAGVNRVFWGVTESRHLVDIVNQSDNLEDLDSETKLGQPMMQLTYLSDFGEISTFILPYFRERQFSSNSGRFRPELIINNNDSLFINDADKDAIDIALRYSHYIGDWDIGLSYFLGNSRDPGFILEAQPATSNTPSSNSATLIPVYSDIQQWGVDLQYTVDAWLWKFESIYVNDHSTIEGQKENYLAAVAGFEYTLYQLFDTSADLGLLMEYNYDNRSEVAPATAFNDDWFLAFRLGMNDSQDTALLAGAYYDPDTGEKFYNIEGETRIGESITAELRLRIIEDTIATDFFHSISQDDYFQFNVKYHF